MKENQWSSYLKQENKLNVHVLFFSCPIPPPPIWSTSCAVWSASFASCEIIVLFVIHRCLKKDEKVVCAVWSWAVLSYLRPTGTNSCSTFWVSVCCDINAAVLLSTPLKGFLLANHDCQRCYSKESFTWKCLHQTPHTRLI